MVSYTEWKLHVITAGSEEPMQAPSPRHCLQCDYTVRCGECRNVGSCFCQGCVWFGSCLRASHQSQMQSSYPGGSSFFDPNRESPYSSLPMNEDFGSVSGNVHRGGRLLLQPSPMLLQNLDYMLNCTNQQVPSYSDDVDKSMGHSGPEVYATKTEGDLWKGVNMDDVQSYFEDGDNTIDLQELFAGPDSILTDPLIDEIIKFSAETTLEATSSSSSSSSPPSLVSADNKLLNSTVEEANVTEPQWGVQLSLSPTMLAKEILPLELNLEVGFDRRAREEAKKRYYAKREIRMYGKQIRYECRKTRADKRRRIRGRFVKEGEEYDYDPQIKKTPRTEVRLC